MSNSSAPLPPLIAPMASTLSNSIMCAKSFTVTVGGHEGEVFGAAAHVERAAAAAPGRRDVDDAARVLAKVGHISAAAVDGGVALPWVERDTAGGPGHRRAVAQRARARATVQRVGALAAVEQVWLVARADEV